MADKPALVKPIEEVVPIAKPSAFDLEKFKSKRAAAAANVETLQTGLPHHSISQAKDFVRLHPDEENYWSPELCFVSVPIKGQKRDTLHLIEEDLAMQYLPSGRILALPLGARDQALRRVLSLPHTNQEHGQPVEREQPGGVRTGKNAVGSGDQSQRGRHRRLQGRRSRASKMPSRNQNGRRSHSVTYWDDFRRPHDRP